MNNWPVPGEYEDVSVAVEKPLEEQLIDYGVREIALKNDRAELLAALKALYEDQQDYLIRNCLYTALGNRVLVNARAMIDKMELNC